MRYLNISKLIQSAQIYTINKKSKKFCIINNYDYSYFEISMKDVYFSISGNIGQYTIMSIYIAKILR